jgi:glycerophosphoryl diester phosphodiesterase
MNLAELFESKEIVITAHRGFSGKYPENTILSLEKAVEIGADVIEFDLRSTSDSVPVVLHDETIDRTSNGSGEVWRHTHDELRGLNFSMFVGTHDTKYRRDTPAVDGLTIPTFKEVLDAFAHKTCMNIQVYRNSDDSLAKICRLYDQFDLYETAYLTMSTYKDASRVRAINPRIELCVLERAHPMDEASLRKQKEFGLTYIQPTWRDVTPELCEVARKLGLRSSMFFSNTDEDTRKYIGYGQQGIMTDCPDIVLRTLDTL